MLKKFSRVGQVTSVLFLSATAVALPACSKHPSKVNQAAGDRSAAPNPNSSPSPTPSPSAIPSALTGCTPSVATLSPSASLAIQNHFASVIPNALRMSAQERDAMFVDRDIKGRRIVYATDQPAPTPDPWAHKDLEKDGVPGTSTARAYAELNLRTNVAPVTVAVIDSAIDIEHEDLKANIWTNDRDDAAFPGAVHGWNFLGGATASVYHTTLEVTREVKRMRALKAAGPITVAQQVYLDQLEADFVKGKQEAALKLEMRTKARDQLSAALEVLRANCAITTGTLAEVQAIQSTNPAIIAARDAALVSLKQGRDINWYKSSIEHWTAATALNDQYYYNLDFDSSSVVGDHPAQMEESYGNADVMPKAEDEIHATHVSGIIGAVRGNGLGMDGQAANVKIMALRAVPDGDERDKDIGNAIKFAVDHGARVINMSFGKGYSPNRQFVWDMLKYAGAHNVLVVHAAGNDSKDNDTISHYPDREVRDDSRNLLETIPNVLEVGASTRNKDKDLPATFSDYGSRTVDLFAPGASIYATVPGNKYEELDGTSMATPEVAGIAALVLSQYPQLNVTQLKEVLLGNVTPFQGLMVVRPGADPEDPTSLVDFATLSQKGGVVNAFKALQAAALIAR